MPRVSRSTLRGSADGGGTLQSGDSHLLGSYPWYAATDMITSRNTVGTTIPAMYARKYGCGRMMPSAGGGMGPVGEIRSTPGKLFAALFALYAGLAFLGVATMKSRATLDPRQES